MDVPHEVSLLRTLVPFHVMQGIVKTLLMAFGRFFCFVLDLV